MAFNKEITDAYRELVDRPWMDPADPRLGDMADGNTADKDDPVAVIFSREQAAQVVIALQHLAVVADQHDTIEMGVELIKLSGLVGDQLFDVRVNEPA